MTIMADPFQHMASVLVPAQAAPAGPPMPAKGTRTQRIRDLLRQGVPMTSRDIAERLHLPSPGGAALVAALLKNDLAKARVVRRGEFYAWCATPEADLQAQLAAAAALLRQHGYIVQRRPS